MKFTKNEQCPECGRFDNRGTSIDAVIINGDKILLIRRGENPFKGFWALPGGYVEWNESAEEAVVREVQEETGLTVTSAKLIGVYSTPERHPGQVINIAYEVSVSGSPKAGDDALEYEWFFLDKLPEEMAFDHKIIIADCITKK